MKNGNIGIGEQARLTMCKEKTKAKLWNLNGDVRH